MISSAFHLSRRHRRRFLENASAGGGGGGSESYDDDTQDWIDRVVTNGGSLTTAQKSAVDTFVLAVKDIGDVWDQIQYMLVYTGGNLASALTPLKVASGGADPATNTNFVSGDFSADGLLGGNNEHLDIELNAVELHSGSKTFVFWYVQEATNAAGYICGATSSANATYSVGGPWTDGNVYSDQYNRYTGSGRVYGSASNKNGLFAAVRLSSSSHKIFRENNTDGWTTVASNTGSGGSLSTRDMYVHASNEAGVAGSHYPRTIGFWCAGIEILESEAEDLSTAIIALQAGLGRDV